MTQLAATPRRAGAGGAVRPDRPSTPRIDGALLDRLAARVTTVARRDALEVDAPALARPLGSVPRCTAEDVGEAVAGARSAQRGWAATPLRERAAVLRRYRDLVLERQDEVLDLLQLESGKARRHAFEEVLDTTLSATYYARLGPRRLAPRPRQGAIPLLTRAWELHHPRGVVGFISPWNYPLTLGISDALPALLAGNGAVIKPDSQTPFSLLWALELLEEAGLPAGLAHAVTGPGRELGAPLIDGVDYLMFTGSTATGRVLAQRAASRLIDFSMELGGKNPMLVLDDADLDWTVEGAVRACFSNAGQLCISMERIYVQSGIWERFTQRFAEITGRLRLSAELDWETDVGSLISPQHLAQVARFVDEARDRGATVLAGGRARPELGPCFYEPTLLADVTPQMSAYCDETFGPVAWMTRVESVDEAVELANDSAYGLNASVWTGDARAGRAVAARLQAGTVNVNEAYAAAWASIDAPMGGFRDSGMGRRHGEHGLTKYTEPQTVAAQRLMPLGPRPLASAAGYARLMTRGVRLLARMPGRR